MYNGCLGSGQAAGFLGRSGKKNIPGTVAGDQEGRQSQRTSLTPQVKPETPERCDDFPGTFAADVDLSRSDPTKEVGHLYRLGMLLNSSGHPGSPFRFQSENHKSPGTPRKN